MKLEDTSPGQIYKTFVDDTELLILITANPGQLNNVTHKPVDYDYLVSSGILYILDYKREVIPVPDSDLPLYIHYHYKTDKFYELLKG